jgi:Melibiase
VTPHVDNVQEIFTVADIAKVVTSNGNGSCNENTNVETIPMTHIRGIGECHTIKVYLRPMSTTTALEHVIQPPNGHLRYAWDQHVQRMQYEHGPRITKQTAVRSTTETKAHSSTAASDNNDHNNNTTTTRDVKDTTDDDDDKNYIGPIITFCVPTSQQVDPPLLWKVYIPPIHEYPISIQTITVLDGQLLHTTPTIQRPIPRPPSSLSSPTHIYINGYQSWSFTGSLCKGQTQPGSALPHTYSRAFNLGGSGPTPATTILQTPNHNNDSHFLRKNTGSRTTTKPFQSQYQSDFFTCITSDGRQSVTTNNISIGSTSTSQYPQIDETGGPALLLGWLSQNEQFGIINVDAQLGRYQMHCSVDGQMLVANNVTGPITTDWAYAQLVHPHSYDEEPMAQYLHNVARYSEVAPLLNGDLLTGWCSWYVYYQNISERLLRDNVTKLSEMRHHIPTNVSVVDDGYMTAWGDWDSLKPKEFPTGLATVASDIAARGMRPGLWLAPFAADKNSVIVQQHPDWVICNESGIAANSSYCGKFFYGLDATNPHVRAHVHEAIRRAVHDWKFDVLKIDFLYAACLVGNNQYDLSISRAQAMRLALQTIRDAAGPDVFLMVVVVRLHPVSDTSMRCGFRRILDRHGLPRYHYLGGIMVPYHLFAV